MSHRTPYDDLTLELDLNIATAAPVAEFRVPPSKTRLRMLDLFCGGGGTTTGALWAFREMGEAVETVDVNHCPDAIRTHELNYPGHVHLCTGVDDISPRILFADAVMDFFWASPVCTHFSSAKGGTPVNPQLRNTPWQCVRWVRVKKPKAFAFENVPEFMSWGPVIQMRDKRGIPLFLRNDGTEKKTKWVRCHAPVKERPAGTPTRRWWADMAARGYKPAFTADPKHKGETVRKFFAHLRREGYDVDSRVLNAADYGAPTSRRRLIIVGVRRSSGMKVVWPRATHAKPDATGTVPTGLRPWVGAKTVIRFQNRGTSIFTRPRPLKEKSIRRILVGLRKYWLKPFLMPGQGYSNLRTRAVDLPLQTIATNSRGEALVTPVAEQVAFLTPGFAERVGQTPRTHDVESPMPTVCAQGHIHLAQGFLLKYRGTNNASDIEAPVPTVTASGTHLGMVEPFLVQVAHGSTPGSEEHRTRSIHEPLPTVCGHRGDVAVCSSFLTQVSHGVGSTEKNPHNRRVKSLDEPLPTATGSNDWGVTQAFILGQQGGAALRSADEPTPTVATAGAIALVETSITGPRPIPDLSLLTDAALAVLEAEILRLALNPGNGRPRVAIGAEVYEIEIFHRMLDDEELAGAQSFPAGYKFSGGKTKKIQQIGNAVPPLLARAVVKALWSQNENVGVFEMPTAA